MLIDFGKAGWIEKARQQPDKVRMVLEKMRTDGIGATLESVRAKLDQPVALGYSNAGVVLEASEGFAAGQRVVSNGPHAEVVSVPKNLCAAIPRGVSDASAAFAVVGAIALEGIRLAQPSLGETFAVIGLGLIGQLTVQLLRAHGCRVVGVDPNPARVALAGGFGAEEYDEGMLVDGALITAATRSNEPVHRAAGMCRKRGRIVLVGVAGLELSRDDFYKKELSFQVSCSYGPGRYDPAYEERGQDYPVGYVRWTAQRNFAAVLQSMAEGKLDVGPLITHRFPFERAGAAYELIQSAEPHLGVVLEYGGADEAGVVGRTVPLADARGSEGPGVNACATVGWIGAGQHAVRMLLPAVLESGARLKIVADSNGVAAAYAGRRFGFQSASTDGGEVLADAAIDTVFIATRHDSHARLVSAALRAGKNVFVEKPLALNEGEIEEIQAAYAGSGAMAMVGFNRRFAPQAVKMKEVLAGAGGPMSMIATVNAGAVASDHWTQDPAVGGGRIIGEACHFVDLLRFLAGAAVVSASRSAVGPDTATLNLKFADGSIGTVHYFANGSKRFPKERIEVFRGGRVLQLDNFRKLTGYGWPGFRKMNLWRQDKGHVGCVAAFLKAVREGGPAPIPFEELMEVTRVTLRLAGAGD